MCKSSLGEQSLIRYRFQEIVAKQFRIESLSYNIIVQFIKYQILVWFKYMYNNGHLARNFFGMALVTNKSLFPARPGKTTLGWRDWPSDY